MSEVALENKHELGQVSRGRRRRKKGAWKKGGVVTQFY